MPALAVRHARRHCTCQANTDAPSTFRGAAHLDGVCQHSTLAETTRAVDPGARARRRAARDAERAATRLRRAAPIRRIVL